MFIRTERSVGDFIRFYPLVTTILIINLFLWVVIDLFRMPIGENIYLLAVGHNYSIHEFGEYWRLITPIFLHAGIGHVAFNSFALVLFGPALERMIGKVSFALIYLATGIAGNVGTYIIDPLSVIPHLGASGAIYGLFGVYIYMSFFRKNLISQSDAQIVRTIFIIGLVMTFIQPNINIPAHIFGFIGGFTIGPIALKNAVIFMRPVSRPRRRHADSDVHFDPDRWQRKRLLPANIRKNLIWIIIAILVLIGLVSRYL